MGLGSNPIRQKQHEIGVAMKEITTQNNFDVMCNLEEQVPLVLEEGEFPQYQDQT